MPNKMKLSDADLLALFHADPDFQANFTPRHYAKKTLVYSPFEEKNLVFVVRSGRLRIYLAYEDKEFTLALLERGDVFSTHTPAFVQALEGTEILVCSTATFGRALARRPELSLTMVKVLGELLQNSIQTIEGLAFKDVRLRLVDFLLGAAADRGRMTPEGTVVQLGLGTEDIALLVGTTRQTISQIINDFIKTDLLVKIDRKTLLIKDLAAFKTLKETP
ncbi:Crp/Fnr family transcriptional regulator [Geomonas sp. Red69]|uniref:Crp/Fnr family transcriptional regulator n=1 Tax=Geomonas diazotrophica TaxID=2843197 RepID=A0ABX8JH13_9BACT|nr:MULTISPECIES: Crp/Fnr family transcriptional regulator [Geomonas]MBU5635334.1 Crp/Fnr family transcriptional regulator [Geomonas diazotrophica]QWV97608.1 Crp/Fnr family transcriptional regulator [Geomonas nitrogeniifigens]QXE86751.1 Crp/Fnr family transcriptional regulator [Geomonas nitrogeniifigens]